MTKDSEQEKGVIHCFVIYSQYCLSQRDHYLLFKIPLAQSCQRKGTASLSYTTGLVGSSHRGKKPNELWIRVWATSRNFQIKRPKALALVPRPPDTVSVQVPRIHMLRDVFRVICLVVMTNNKMTAHGQEALS